MLKTHDANLAAATGFNFINGQKVTAVSGESIAVFCPSDGLEFASIARSSAADIDAAVQSSHQTFHSDHWRKTSPLDRGRLLTKLMHLVERDGDALAALESRDTGKPYKQGVADVRATIRYLEFYGGAGDKLGGDTIPFLDGYTALTLREPHGVVAGIIPWNYPLQILSRKMSSAIAMGNTFVAKPAEDASLTSLRLAELALEAGFPAGVFNVVTGFGHEAGAALAAHPLVDFVTFTGSTTTGTLIQTAAAQNNRGTTMELGGKSAQIVFADADLEAAAPVIVNAIIQNSGQTCSAGARVLIERPVYEKFAAMLAIQFSQLVAAPHDFDADLGAMINGKQAARVKNYIEEAITSGIECLARGVISPDVPDAGAYVAPALFGNVPENSKLAQEEVFGPVLVLMPFDDEVDAIRLANSTPFGLVAGVWTLDGARQHRVAKRVRAGQVYVNAYGAGGGVELPFGGFGKSGHGREKGIAGLIDMSAVKTIVFKHN